MINIRKALKLAGVFLVIFVAMVLSTVTVSAHCDTMDGPVVGDAKKSIETNNLNYILKWVKPQAEKEITKVFELTMNVRSLSPEAKELADSYLFENLVRIHRAGEGAPFDGVKPSGSPIDEKILAADRSVEAGNLSPLEKMIPDKQMPELRERFEKVMNLKNFDVNDVKAGREYVEAYVTFFHLAEGEESGENHEGLTETSHTNDIAETHKSESQAENAYLQFVPWILSGVFLLTSILLGISYFKRSKYNR